MWCYLVLLGVIGRDPLRRKRYILHTHRKKSYLILEISFTEKDILRRERSPPQRKIFFAEKDLLRSDRTGPQCIVPHLNARSSRINTLRYNFFTSMGPRLTAFLKQLKNAAPLIVSREHSMNTSCHSQTLLQLQVTSQPIIIVFWTGQ